jgi:hypothetical protein
MNPSEEHVVDVCLLDNLADDVPADVERRLRSQLAEFRRRLAQPAVLPSDRGRRRAGSHWWKAGAVIAGAVAISMVLVVFQSPASLADVAAAVFAKPWIHLRITSTAGRESEAWYSSARSIAASRSADSINYDDNRLQIHYSYKIPEKTLYRLPQDERNSSGELEGFVAIVNLLLEQKGVPQDPLERLPFFGRQRAKTSVLQQTLERVNENGHSWLDYQLTVKGPMSSEPVHMRFRTDAATKLLQTVRIEAIEESKPASLEMQFSYPATGPGDVYALGVPASAKLVDRVPAGDLQRILETIRAGRERMDNYRAVFVMQYEGSPLWNAFPTLRYRKGNLFRAEHVRAGERLPDSQPSLEANPAQWWPERVKQLHFWPEYVKRGTTMYSVKCQSVTAPDRTVHDEIVSVHTFDYNTPPGETCVIDYSMRPEFVCRPPLGVGGQDQDASIELHPSDGPAGCILLRVKHTSAKDRVNQQGVGLPDENRFWLDPNRDDIAMRWDCVARDAKGTERIIDCYTVEEVSKSPQGVWYASRVRRTSGRKGTSPDQIYHFYVDFSADLPDSLFDPPRPGRLN